MINLIISGAPGSGKGTQSDLIVDRFRFKHLSTGDLLRAELAAGSTLGKQAEQYIANGALVPDALVISMLINAIDHTGEDYSGLILDGFPRTVEQAEALEKILTERGRKIDIFLDIRVEEEELVERLLLRGKTSGRQDDNMETIRERLKVYHQKTEPVCDFYKKNGCYKRIDGRGEIEEIHGKIADILREFEENSDR